MFPWALLPYRRLPCKLLLTWRQGYGAPKTKSADVGTQLLQVSTALDAR